MSLAAVEGRWSCWVKRKGEFSLCGDGEACGHWAGVSSLVTGCSNPLPRCFFLTGLWEEEKGRAWGTQSFSQKKALRERREARLKLSQREQSVPLSAASAWDFPKHGTHSTWVSSLCRGDLNILQWRRDICNNAVKFALLVRLFGSMPDGCRGWPSLRAGCCEILMRLLEAFQWRIPASAKSQQRRKFVAEEKKSEMGWQAVI